MASRHSTAIARTHLGIEQVSHGFATMDVGDNAVHRDLAQPG